MAWLWNNNVTSDLNFTTESSSRVDSYSTRKIVKSNCRTEEVEPGRFVRKCEKTVEVLKDCLGKPTEVVESTKEYTESNITGQVKISSSNAGDSETQPFEFSGLQRDIEAMERSLFGGISRFLGFLDAADELKSEIFRDFDDLPSSGSEPPSSSTRSPAGIPIEDHIQKPAAKNDDGSSVIDLSGFARDV